MGKPKVTYADLSTTLKIAVIFALINGILLILSFLLVLFGVIE